jgi:hypothetical protein
MKKCLCTVIFLLLLIVCKKEENVSEETTSNNGKVDYKSIEAQVAISEGSIIGNSRAEFDNLKNFDPKLILNDFDYFVGKRNAPFVSIEGINNDLISQRLFNEAIVWFRFGHEKEKIEYSTQTYSPFDTAGSNSDGMIKEVKCPIYSDSLIKCKFYFATSNPENGMPPMSWVIVTIKDRALVNVEDDLGASFLGYIDTDKQYPEKYLSNLKKALKVAVKDPKIGLKDEQLQGFTVEELDLLTDGLASQVKAVSARK